MHTWDSAKLQSTRYVEALHKNLQNLHVLKVLRMCHCRCPKLKEFIFQDYLLYHKEENLLPLKQLFQASPKLEVLQVHTYSCLDALPFLGLLRGLQMT
jgi:hypothetical protein